MVEVEVEADLGNGEKTGIGEETITNGEESEAIVDIEVDGTMVNTVVEMIVQTKVITGIAPMGETEIAVEIGLAEATMTPT